MNGRTVETDILERSAPFDPQCDIDSYAVQSPERFRRLKIAVHPCRVQPPLLVVPVFGQERPTDLGHRFPLLAQRVGNRCGRLTSLDPAFHSASPI